MKSAKKKPAAKVTGKMKDLPSKKNPKGGALNIGSAGSGGGGGKSIKTDSASPKFGWIE